MLTEYHVNKVKSSIIIIIRVHINGVTKLSVSWCDRVKFANRIYIRNFDWLFIYIMTVKVVLSELT